MANKAEVNNIKGETGKEMAAMEQRRTRIMIPTPPKKESEIMRANEKWEYEAFEVDQLDPSNALPKAYGATAIKCILAGLPKLKEQLD